MSADLIARLEAAGVDEQRDMLRMALVYAYEHGWIDSDAEADGYVWSGCGAYESAAMLLVPEGWDWELHVETTEPTCPTVFIYRGFENRGTRVPFEDEPGKNYRVDANTPALALAAAAVKAKESDHG